MKLSAFVWCFRFEIEYVCESSVYYPVWGDVRKALELYSAEDYKNTNKLCHLILATELTAFDSINLSYLKLNRIG